MSIASEISRLQTAKADIKTAIEAKGVTVPSSATIDTYDDYVSQISGGGGGATPSAFTSWDYDDWGKPTNIVIKNGVTSIPSRYQYYNSSLSSCTMPSSVTDVGSYAFSNVGNPNRACDISNINFTNVAADSGMNNVFAGSYLKGSITITNKMLSGATSATTSTCYNFFNSASVQGGNTLTIHIYADGVIVPRAICNFSVSSSLNNGGLDIIVHGTPTFLSQQAFATLTGVTGTQKITFADCTTPPDASSYTATGASSPFKGVKGNIYVPSAGLTAWQTKYSDFSSQIKAIGT